MLDWTPSDPQDLAMRALLLLLLLAAPTATQTGIFAHHGEEVGAGLGVGVAILGDLDGDGFDEYAVGAPNQANGGLSAAGEVVVYAGRTGLSLYAWRGLTFNSYLGQSVVGLADIDGDGVHDFAVAEPGLGLVHLRSGASGSHLSTAIGPGGNFGFRLAEAGDVDLDGTPDLLASAPLAPAGGFLRGSASVVSGATGALLLTVVGDADQDQLGTGLTGLGDLDADGVPEFAASAFHADRDLNGDGVIGFDETTVGMVRVFSGASGAEHMTIWGTAGLQSLGHGLARAGDLDGDGLEDLVAGATYPYSNSNPCLVRTFSGATGALLLEIVDGSTEDHMGFAVAPFHDHDGDGTPDLLVGVPGKLYSDYTLPGLGHWLTNATHAGFARLYSGATGALLFEVAGGDPGADFGKQLGRVTGDVNGDGRTDLIVGAPRQGPPHERMGAAYVYSAESLALAADDHTISLSAGGTVTFGLAAGSAHAGHVHALLGSLSGIAPGVALGGVTLPLNPDAYMLFTLATPGPPLTGGIGILDATGAATASFAVPAASSPAFAGVLIDHAYLTLDAGGAPVLASHHVPISLQP